MDKREAVNLLNIEETEINPEIVKAAYRKACSKYHPDRNAAGLEMMKMINIAYELLRECNETIEHKADINYSDDVNTALNAIVGLQGIEIEICGTWVWVTGNTFEHKEIFKGAGYYWASKKLAWYFKPDGQRTSSRGQYVLADIRLKHGSEKVAFKQRQQLKGAA
jgi:hypothetical protein